MNERTQARILKIKNQNKTRPLISWSNRTMSVFLTFAAKNFRTTQIACAIALDQCILRCGELNCIV